ncbi:hypothetical protein EI94DRAFT_1796401 [Lactarius quietus]|nr:hypothetical protein EI94DRAFT_1796401 [Lactarius quietus]
MGSKLDTRAIKGQWVGYDKDSTHTHQIYVPDKNSIAVKQDVRFVLANVTVYTAPSTNTPAPTATAQAPQLTLPPTTLPPALPPVPATTKPTPSNVPLPDSDEDSRGDEEEGGEWEVEDQPNPALPGKCQSPTVSKPATQSRASGPSYAQPMCTSTCKKFPSNIDRRITAGEGTADRRVAGRKAKKKTGASAALLDELAYLSTDSAFIAELTPVVASAISESQDDPSSVNKAQSHSDWPLWQ